MKYIYLTLIFNFIILYSYSQQNISITFKDSVYLKSKNRPVGFKYINKEFNLKNNTKIAILQGFSKNSKKQNLSNLYRSFREIAHDLGANSFIMESFLIKSDSTKVIVSVYYLTEQEIARNLGYCEKNNIYIIGTLNKKKQKGKKIKLNNKAYLLKPLEYIEYKNKVGEELTIGIGGFLGSKLWIKGKENRLPNYLSVVGFGVGPSHTGGGIGFNFNTGKIHPVNLNLGQFLISILNKKNL